MATIRERYTQDRDGNWLIVILSNPYMGVSCVRCGVCISIGVTLSLIPGLHPLWAKRGDAMLFNLEKEGFLRKLILAAFVLAMLGPWSFDLVNIPAQFPCEGLPVRLAGDFCGFPVSGFGGIIMVSTCLFRLPGVLATGNIAMLFPELTAVFIMLFVFLPVFSFLPLLRKKGSHRLQIMNLILWVLGGFAALAMLAMQAMRPQVAPVIYLVWGIWLYILAAMGAVTLEVIVLRKKEM